MITVEQIKQLYPRAKPANVAAFASAGPALLDEFGISDLKIRLQFFLAQLGHESGGLTIAEENLSYSAERMMVIWPTRFPTLASASPFARNPEKLANHVYSSRMGNGPAPSGDGWRYRGRGYIQITGKEGYREVGLRCGLDLMAKPDRAFAAADALHVACAFWKWKRLNAVCDTGDFKAVTKRINGGTIGLTDRIAWLDKVRRVLASPPTGSTQPASHIVRAVQLALQERGSDLVGAADGIIGPRTAAAIELFRDRNGLGEGLIDDTLLAVFAIN